MVWIIFFLIMNVSYGSDYIDVNFHLNSNEIHVDTLENGKIYITAFQGIESGKYLLPSFHFYVSDSVKPKITIEYTNKRKISNKSPALFNEVYDYMELPPDSIVGKYNISGGIKRDEYVWEIKFVPFSVENDGIYVYDVHLKLTFSSYIQPSQESILLNSPVKTHIVYRRNKDMDKRGIAAKLKVYKDGIYRIKIKDIKDIGIIYGVTPSNYISMYERDDYYLTEPPDTIPSTFGKPIYCYVKDGGDGVLDPYDEIIFYGRGVTSFPGVKYRDDTLQNNPYSLFRTYFITLEENNRHLVRENTYSSYTDTIMTIKKYIDIDRKNPSLCGVRWIYSSLSPLNPEDSILLHLPPFCGDINMTLLFAFQHSDSWRDYPFSVYFDNSMVCDTIVKGYYDVKKIPISFNFDDKNFDKYIKIVFNNTTDTLYWDALYIEGKSRVYADTVFYNFFSDDTIIVNVKTLQDSVFAINDSLKTIYISNGDCNIKTLGNLFVSSSIERIYKDEIEYTQPSLLLEGLDNYDYWIIGPPGWEWALKPLMIKRSKEGISSVYIDINDIYEKFSGGMKDAGAIKYLLRYYYYNYGYIPSYVLLIGDASYDMRNLYHNYPPTDIMPAFSYDDIVRYDASHSSNKISDWWQVMITDDNYPDCPIGRLTGATANEIFNQIKKVLSNERKLGLNGNVVVAMPDDEYSSRASATYTDSFFTLDMERILNNLSSSYELYKLYLMDYWGDLQTSDHWDANPGYKPEVTLQLKELMRKGIGFVFFHGHSSEYAVAHEHVLEYPRDKYTMKNINGYYPFLFIGGCSSAFMDQFEETILEGLIKIPNAGFVASYGSSRTSSAPRNNGVMSPLIKGLSRGDRRIGDWIFNSYDTYGYYFIFFGEPTMIIVPDSVGNCDASISNDTVFISMKDVPSGKYSFSIYMPYTPDSHDYWHEEPYRYIYWSKPGDRFVTYYFNVQSDMDTVFTIPSAVPAGTIRVQLFYEDGFKRVLGKKLFYNGNSFSNDTIKPYMELYVNGKPYNTDMEISGNNITFYGIVHDNLGVSNSRDNSLGLYLYSDYTDTTIIPLYPYITYYGDTVLKFKYIIENYSNKKWDGIFHFCDISGNSDSLYCSLEINRDVVKDLLPYYSSEDNILYIGFYLMQSSSVNYRIIDKYGRIVYSSSPVFLRSGYNKIKYNGDLKKGLYIVELDINSAEKKRYFTKIVIER